MSQQKTWFTSDNHFFHKRIREFCPETRHGANVEEMNELMIEKWNSQVALTDTVNILGDFSFAKSEETLDILGRLNGRFTLIKGNHDYWISPETKAFFDGIFDYKKITIGKQKVIMFHYPIMNWDSMHHGSFHLYGHLHGDLQLDGRAMDVGIDARPQKDMGLWEWDEVYEILKNRPIMHHHK